MDRAREFGLLFIEIALLVVGKQLGQDQQRIERGPDVRVLHAERGAEGISILETAPDVDVALVDIMMPEMDGYETMRRIRSRPAIASIPLIAVTAKAMKGDRQKCLDAGASDYIAKPVDIDLLLALMRVWIGRARAERLSGAPRGSSRAA